VKPVILRPEARIELREIAGRYQTRDPRVTAAFLVEIDEILLRIEEAPAQFPAWTVNPAYRKAVLPVTFPFIVFFREKPDRVEVMAIAHGARNPGYWADQ
jgi:plasmid stabilization system protein ParE